MDRVNQIGKGIKKENRPQAPTFFSKALNHQHHADPT